MEQLDRRVGADIALFAHAADLPLRTSLAVEGIARPGKGELKIRKLMVGADVLMLEAFRLKGQIDPPHRHMDHESIGYLLSGRLKLIIDGESFIAEAGSVWRHPKGVEHSSEALEDCHQIEIKSPPAKTWVTSDK